MTALSARLAPCGPVTDRAAAERVRGRLLVGDALPPPIAEAWTALAPVFAASPYLARLAARAPGRASRKCWRAILKRRWRG